MRRACHGSSFTSCDCYEYFFPRIFWPLQVLPRIPGGVSVMVEAMRLRTLHRLPMAFGLLTKRPVSRDLADAFLLPSRRDRHVRQDLKRFLLGVDNRLTLEAATRLAHFEKPVLLAWSRDDRRF